MAVLPLLLAAQPALAHGGVVAEDDLCVINIGYLKAHFKMFVPARSGHREYCEDIPLRGETVFVMEYLHDGLSAAPIDFRIVRNTTGKGNFARLSDIDALPDLDAVTVSRHPSAVAPGVYTALHEFDDDGEYIGIVVAQAGDKRYTAVFPFTVGDTGAGVWPWLLAAIVILQLNFWYWTRRRRRPHAAAGVLAALLLAGAHAPATAEEYSAAGDRFRVTATPSLQPLTINRMHAWDLVLTDDNGEPVSGARIDVAGGMPAHDHGLPTQPQVTGLEAPGHYRIEGLRFHMPGEWELVLTITAGPASERLVLSLVL